jgi:iron complex transport system ATP-binding protein
MNNETVILHDVAIGYRQRHSQRLVASHLSAHITAGKLTCLLGENGVGKSTLLRTLSGFQPCLQGQVIIDGQPIDAYTDQELARKIGVVLTERPDVQQMTVSELVSLGRSPYTGFWGRLTEADLSACREAIQQVGIGELSTRYVTTLSDGERQKVMIAKALAQQTPIIYLDEPTAFLDYPSKVDMLLLLHRISHETGKTVFLSTHDLELALQVADEVWLMERGGQLNIGSPRQLADSGVLTCFVERSHGVRFNPQSLTVSVQSH